MADKSKKDAKKADVKDQNPDAPGFGWSRYAEKTNGRFAMIGFISLLLLEVFTQQDIFTWLGLR
jgi:hypothetical protein